MLGFTYQIVRASSLNVPNGLYNGLGAAIARDTRLPLPNNYIPRRYAELPALSSSREAAQLVRNDSHWKVYHQV